MTRYKGVSRKGAIDQDDLIEIVDCYRRIQKIHASLNYQSPQQMPLLAASATLKACWAELSGEASYAWDFPACSVPLDGLGKVMRQWIVPDSADGPDSTGA